MEKSSTTFSDKYVVQVIIQNNYKSGQISNIELRTPDWELVPGAILSHKSAYLGAGNTLTVTALIPFEPGKTTRLVYLCHAITPKSGASGAAYRGEVCGKYSARRLS